MAKHGTTAKERAQAIPGARGAIGTLNGRPASRLTLANINLGLLRLEEAVRSRRAAEARTAGALRMMQAGLKRLRAELAGPGPDAWFFESEDPRASEAYWAALREVVDAIEKATALTPPPPTGARSVPAAQRGRLSVEGRAAELIVDLGFPATPATVRDVAAAAGGIRAGGPHSSETGIWAQHLQRQKKRRSPRSQRAKRRP